MLDNNHLDRRSTPITYALIALLVLTAGFGAWRLNQKNTAEKQLFEVTGTAEEAVYPQAASASKALEAVPAPVHPNGPHEEALSVPESTQNLEQQEPMQGDRFVAGFTQKIRVSESAYQEKVTEQQLPATLEGDDYYANELVSIEYFTSLIASNGLGEVLVDEDGTDLTAEIDFEQKNWQAAMAFFKTLEVDLLGGDQRVLSETEEAEIINSIDMRKYIRIGKTMTAVEHALLDKLLQLDISQGI